MLGLGHVGVHVLEIPQLGSGPVPCVGVEGIPSLVYLHGHEDVVFFGRSDEVEVMLEGLDDGLGDHDVHTASNAGEGDFVVRVVGSEDDGDVALLEGGDGVDVGCGVDGVVGGEGVAGEVHVFVDVADVLLHVVANAREFLALGCK